MITNADKGVVTCIEEVEWMTELNNRTFAVRVINPRYLTIGDAIRFSKYTAVHRPW